MTRYRVRDVILSDVLGYDYYLPEDRNWAEDIEDGWHIHLEDAKASRLVAEVEDEEGNTVFERELPVRNNRLVADIYYGDYGIEGALAGAGLSGSVTSLATKNIKHGLLSAIIGGILGFIIGKAKKDWKIRLY